MTDERRTNATEEEAALLARARAVIDEVEAISLALGLSKEEAEAEDWSGLFLGMERTVNLDGVAAGTPVVDRQDFDRARAILAEARTDRDRFFDAVRLVGALAAGAARGAS